MRPWWAARRAWRQPHGARWRISRTATTGEAARARVRRAERCRAQTRHTTPRRAKQAGSAAPSARRAPNGAASAPCRRERAALAESKVGTSGRGALAQRVRCCAAQREQCCIAAPRKRGLRNGRATAREGERRRRGHVSSGARRTTRRDVSEPKLPALLMLVAQCAVRPCASARSRIARAQAAAPPRSLRGFAAARRKRSAAAVATPHSGAARACTRLRVAHALDSPRPSAAAPRRLVTTCGLPIIGSIPVVGPLLSSPLVTVAWAVGGFKLFTGFSKTTYTDALLPKLALCALWCVSGPALRVARCVPGHAGAVGRADAQARRNTQAGAVRRQRHLSRAVQARAVMCPCNAAHATSA